MARPILHDDVLRLRLLASTVELVGKSGVAGVSLRDVANASETSVAAIYSLFGGKQELLAAVVDEGFRSFGTAQHDAAKNGLLALGHAYRAWALEHPQLYSLMFSGSLGAPFDCFPTPAVAGDAIEPLLQAVSAALSAHHAEEDHFSAAIAIWGQVHGLVSLELAGGSAQGNNWEAIFSAALRGIARAYLSGAPSEFQIENDADVAPRAKLR